TLQQPEIDATQTHVRRTCEQRLERTLVITKIRCPRVTGTDAAPVFFVPPPIADEHVADALLESTAHHNRNRQPDRSTGALDPVPVAPVPLRVLHVVEQDEFVDRRDEVEIAFPWDIARLNDGDTLRHAGVDSSSVRALIDPQSRASAARAALQGCHHDAPRSTSSRRLSAGPAVRSLNPAIA